MAKVIQTICSMLEQGEDLVLATILSHEGSTPRTAGTKMVIRRGGESIATVGGGLVEGEVIKASEEAFHTRQAQIMSFDLTGENVEGMDLICGGSLDILVEFIEATPGNLLVFQGLSQSLRERQRSWLVADLGTRRQAPGSVKRCLIMENGTVCGDLTPPQHMLERLGHWTGRERYPVLLTIEDHRYLMEPSFVLGTVYLFGAGHVSQQVAPLAKLVDFQTVVVDDRAAFANRERFPGADEVRVLEKFDDSLQSLDISDESYVVILTRGHLHDKTVLEQALRTSARYIGMIGSRTKRDRIYTELKDSGFTESDLARVHAPIGMNIAAETPEEIGISIVGELIKARAGKE